MGALSEVRKEKKRTAGQDARTGALALGAGYAAASPRHYSTVEDALDDRTFREMMNGVPKARLTPGAKGVITGVRGVRGAATGAVGGLVVNALRRDKKETASKAFAAKDQNSSIGTSTSTVLPDGRNKAAVTNAHTSRSGVFAGKQRGVGRNLSRDENSTPGHTVIRTPTLRQINGKFAGEGQGVKVFHPARYGSSHRQPRDTRVQIWRKNGDDVARTFTGKQKEKVGKGMLGPVDLASMAPHTGARVGRRIPR